MSRRKRKISVTDTVQVLYDTVVVQQSKGLLVGIKSVSRSTVPTEDRKKITNKVQKGGGSEETVDSKNANKCNVLLVVHKGIEIKGVVGFKMANNRNGLAWSDSNLYRMSGTVVNVGGVAVVGINITATKNSNKRETIIVVVFDGTRR